MHMHMHMHMCECGNVLFIPACTVNVAIISAGAVSSLGTQPTQTSSAAGLR